MEVKGEVAGIDIRFCPENDKDRSYFVWVKVDKPLLSATKVTLVTDESSEYSRRDYEEGIKCEYCGVKVIDMTREQLIAFIGQLDGYITFRLQKHSDEHDE